MSTVALDEFARLASLCRLDPVSAQRVFRTLMESSSRPGSCVRLDPIPGVPPVLLPLLALCDLETSIAVCGESSDRDSWASLVTAVTGARRDRPASASWIAVLDEAGLADSLTAPRGTPDAPESAARVIVAADRLRNRNGQHPAERSTVVTVSGPGVVGTCRVSVEGIEPDFFTALDAGNRFPCGRDVWLVDRDGVVVGLPRSSTLVASHDGSL